MKKISYGLNLLLLSVCIILAVSLMQARRELQGAENQAALSARSIMPAQTAAITSPEPTAATSPPKPTDAISYWDKEESYFMPLGSLPFQVTQFYTEQAELISSNMLRETNPIDSAFEKYWGKSFSTLEENVMVGHYKNYWCTEMLRALDLVATRANPYREYLLDNVNEIKDSLSTFAQANATLYADVIRSHYYLAEGRTHDETITKGSAYPGAQSAAKAAFFRAYTFYLYDMLSFLDMHPDFVFDSTEVDEEWGYTLE